jgi:hypothetical protein
LGREVLDPLVEFLGDIIQVVAVPEHAFDEGISGFFVFLGQLLRHRRGKRVNHSLLHMFCSRNWAFNIWFWAQVAIVVTGSLLYLGLSGATEDHNSRFYHLWINTIFFWGPLSCQCWTLHAFRRL